MNRFLFLILPMTIGFLQAQTQNTTPWEQLNQELELLPLDTLLPETAVERATLSRLILKTEEGSESRRIPVPEALCDCESLLELQLIDYDFAQMPPCLERLTKLRKLSLKGYGLQVFPPWILSAKELVILDLWATFNSYITQKQAHVFNSLPENITSLSRLSYLELGENPVSALPKDLRPWMMVSYIGIGATRIPSDAKEMKRIRKQLPNTAFFSKQ